MKSEDNYETMGTEALIQTIKELKQRLNAMEYTYHTYN